MRVVVEGKCPPRLLGSGTIQRSGLRVGMVLLLEVGERL